MLVCRFDHPDGGKDILPLTFCQKDGKRAWRWKGLPPPRPLYGLERLSARPDAPVIVTEGEKAADAAAEMLPDHVAMTWPNGGKAAAKADWGPLAGREIVLWPDDDAPGSEAMADVAGCLARAGALTVRIIEPPGGVAGGWDAADAMADIEAGKITLDMVLDLVVKAELQGVTSLGGGSEISAAQGGEKRKKFDPNIFLMAAGEIELWHTPDREGWATVQDGRGFANYALDDPRFEAWLIYQWYKKGLDTPSREGMGKILANLRSRAVFEGAENKTFIRVAGSLDTGVYVDLGGPDWNALKLSAGGWEIVARPPVKFRRGRGTQLLPRPDETGKIEDIWRWFNCSSDDDRMMLLTWLLSSLRPNGPYPVLVLTGPPGAAKTTTAKFARRLIDPNMVLVSSIPSDERDLTAAVPNSWVLAFDNVSKIPAWLSDRLCMVSTGSGIRERQLHTNAGEILIEACRPIILNGIGDLATRSDLADRAILVNLDPPSRRRAEFTNTTEGKSLDSEFKAALPQMLGALFGVFCAAMKIYQAGMDYPGGNPRMVDFAIWGNAVGQAMGWEAGAFDGAYAANRSEADEIALEDCRIWGPLQEIFPTGSAEWVGSATDLKEKILGITDAAEKKKIFNTMKPNTYSGELLRITPLINKLGWVARRSRTGKKGRRWHITPPPEPD